MIYFLHDIFPGAKPAESRDVGALFMSGKMVGRVGTLKRHGHCCECLRCDDFVKTRQRSINRAREVLQIHVLENHAVLKEVVG